MQQAAAQRQDYVALREEHAARSAECAALQAELAEGEPSELAIAGCDWREEHEATLVEEVA